MKAARSISLLGSVVLALALTAGCGDDSAPTKDKEISPVAEDAALVKRLPADVQQAGVLDVGTDASSPPMQFLEPGSEKLVGFEIDLGDALGQLLGLEVKWTNLSSAALVPALQNGRFDLAMASAQDLPERQEIFDFVDYFNVGSNLLVKKDNAGEFVDFASLCGQSLGVQAGTAQLFGAEKQQEQCGNNPIDIQRFPTNDAAFLALNSDRVDAVFAQTIVNAYVMTRTPDQYAVSDEAYDETPVGAVLPKNSELVPVINDALTKLIDNGTYAEIVEKWGLEVAAVSTVTLNAG